MPRRFSASSAKQLMACPGSANLELAIPGWVEPVSDDTAGAKGVGTLIHSYLEQFFNVGGADHFATYAAWNGCVFQVLADMPWRARRALFVENDPNSKYADVVDDFAYRMHQLCPEQNHILWMHGDNGLVCDMSWRQEDVELIRTIGAANHEKWVYQYLADALHYLAAEVYNGLYEDSAYVEICTIGIINRHFGLAEKSFHCTWLESQPRTTVDLIAFIPNPTVAGQPGTFTLHVVDYKTGVVPVEVEDNDQLMFYAASAIAEYGATENVTKIRMHILQRKNFVSFEIDRSYLDSWMLEAQRADERIRNKDLTLRAGSHCTFCPANPHSRGDKAAPWCPVISDMLYPSQVDADDILGVTP